MRRWGIFEFGVICVAETEGGGVCSSFDEEGTRRLRHGSEPSGAESALVVFELSVEGREDTQSTFKPIKKKVIKQVPLRPKEPSPVEPSASEQYRREVQQATVTEYNNTRVLPTINDPKIYSVRVRVVLLPPSHLAWIGAASGPLADLQVPGVRGPSPGEQSAPQRDGHLLSLLDGRGERGVHRVLRRDHGASRGRRHVALPLRLPQRVPPHPHRGSHHAAGPRRPRQSPAAAQRLRPHEEGTLQGRSRAGRSPHGG